MKIKKVVVVMSTLIFVLSMSVSAFANESDGSVSGNEASKSFAVQEKVKEKKAELQEKKAGASDFRAAVKEERDGVKEKRDLNRALRQENTALRKELSASLKAQKEAGTILDEETAAKLAAYSEELKSVTEELKNTKGDIKAIAEEKKEALKALDYEAMEAAFAEIGGIQEVRNDALVRINSLFKEMLALVQE
ncbi:MAG: hypothetical protein K0Q48_2912 [Bacillota bacterium]|nr:hypothetical protein [Bacillota bacterium]